jgi:hypothetical protein
MVYCSIDIETSGLNPEQNQILSIAAIVEDTVLKLNYVDLAKFNVILLQHEINGSPRALTMNEGVIKLIGTYLDGDDRARKECEMYSGYQFLKPDDVAKEFYKFLWENYFTNDEHNCPFTSNTKSLLINVAGKNFGTFDKLFLEKLSWWKKLIQPKQRIIDPAVLFCNWEDDEDLPSLTICKERAEIEGEVSHNALHDAWDVIQVLRKFY